LPAENSVITSTAKKQL